MIRRAVDAGGAARFVRIAIAGAVLLASCRPALAQPEMTLAGELELARLIDVASVRMGLNIEYDAQAVRGTVTLRLGGSLTDEELWSLVNQLLAARGLATVQVAGAEAVSVVRMADAAALAPPRDAAVEGGGYQSLIVRPQSRVAADIASAVKPLMSRSGAVTVLGDSGLILLSDLAPRLELVLEFIDDIDVAPAPTVIERVELAQLSPELMVSAISHVRAAGALSEPALPGQIMAAPDGAALLLVAPRASIPRWRDLIDALDVREPVDTRTYSVTHFAVSDVAALLESTIGTQGDPRWRVVQDQLLQSLIVTATSTQHAETASTIERLNNVDAAARRQVRTIRINNRQVASLVEVVEALIDAGMLSSGAEFPDEGDAVDAGEQESELVITSDEQTSSIIAMGSPRLLDALEGLVAQLDVRQAQVMLEVLMVGMTESQARELGVELQGQFTAGASTVSLASLFGLGSPAVAVGADDDAPAASGFTGLVLNPGDFSVLVRALERLNEGRTLTQPRLLVSNNEEAVLNSVSQQPTTAINASQTVSTTSFAGFESAGTQITIRPQIAEGDHLLVEYSVSLSSFEGDSSEAGVPPPRQENSIQSVATIPDGYTIVVGGIDVSVDGSGETRVPLIGRIPVVGELFKTRSKSSSTTRFYTFIRPTVLRLESFEDLKYVSDGHVARMGLDDDWPTLEPRVIR